MTPAFYLLIFLNDSITSVFVCSNTELSSNTRGTCVSLQGVTSYRDKMWLSPVLTCIRPNLIPETNQLESNYLSSEITACNVVLSSHTIFFILLTLFTILTNSSYPRLVTTCFTFCFPYRLGKYFFVIGRCRAYPTFIRNWSYCSEL